MKKMVIILLVFLCIGCNQSNTTDDLDETANKKTVTISEQLLYEDQIMTIVVKESIIDLNQDGMFINFEITNHSNKAIVIYSESMVINNVSVSGHLWAEVEPNSTITCFSEYYQSYNYGMNLESIASITYRLYLSKMGKNDYECYKTTDYLTILTNDLDYEYTFVESGTLEMDVDGYKLWSLGTYEDDENAYVNICCYNDTETDVRFQTRRVIVNGYIPRKSYGYINLPPHTYYYGSIYTSLEDLAKVNTTSISNMTLEVEVMRQGDDKRMIDKQTIFIKE